LKLKASLTLLSLAAVLIWCAVALIPDNKLHVYFCDVGQGDGALIVRGTTQLLIDAGPNDQILNCLSAYVPFYDRIIEGIIITHPQQDHIGGLISIAESYSVRQLFIPPTENNIRVYRQLLQSDKFNTTNLYTGDGLKWNDIEFSVVWPTREFVDLHTESNGKVLGWKSDGTDLNAFSISGILTFGNFDILFTGDADAPIEPAEIATGLLRPVEVLKVPHHGSKTGMLPEWLALVSPQLAVISVSKTNSYGHPTALALEMLTKFTDKIYRTDLNGTIEVVSDGETYWVK
jgi:competence protein ComEC